LDNNNTKRIAIFASGSGTNALNIHNYFNNNSNVEIAMLVYNKLTAKVADKMRNVNVPCLFIHKENFNNPEILIKTLQTEKIDLIVLAGFLWLLPKKLIVAFENKIVNIHPSLLPKFGGKGMFGNVVYQKVLENKETESGITIHYVNENYDEGKIILQEKVKIAENETAESLTKKIHELEYEFYPKAIEALLS